MITVYRPGNSLLHRTPVSIKLIVLALALLAISIFAKDVWSVSALLVVSIAGFFAAGANTREVFKLLWGLKFVVLFVLVPQIIFMTWNIALLNTGRLITCILLATLLTLTSRNQEILDVIERLAKPIGRFGVRPQTIALLVAMTLNSISLLSKFMVDIREAQLARGIKPRIHRMAVPMLVKSLKHADDYAEALQARGVEL